MRLQSLVLTAALFSAGLAAHAETLTYSESTIASGTLGATPFTDALVTITGTGDTADITNGISGVYVLTLPAEVTIAGIGSTEFTDTIAFVSNQGTELAGVGDFTNGFGLLFTENPAFGAYALATPIGPTTGDAFFNPGESFGTADGGLVLGSTSGEATFEAVPTPEPGGFALLGTGALGAAGLLRRRGVSLG